MQTNAELDVQITTVYSAIKGHVDWNNLVPTLLAAAGVLETMTELKGVQKMEILQKALKHALKESSLSVVEKERILHTIETIVPVAVQAAVMASKSPIANAIAQTGCFCWMK